MGAKGSSAHFQLGAWPLLLVPEQIPNAVHVHLQPCAVLSGTHHAAGGGGGGGGGAAGGG